MSYADYQVSRQIARQRYPFYALIMAAMRQADSRNLGKLKRMWPDVLAELDARYNAPRGMLPAETETVVNAQGEER